MKLLSVVQLVSQIAIVGCVYTFFYKVSPVLAAITFIAHVAYELTDHLVQQALIAEMNKAKSDYYEQLNNQIGGGNC